MDITAELLAEIEEKARNTGDVSWFGMGDMVKTHPGADEVCRNPQWSDPLGSPRRERWNCRRKHIARMDPLTTLALVSHIRDLEAENRELRRPASDTATGNAAASANLRAMDDMRQKVIDAMCVPEDMLKGAR